VLRLAPLPLVRKVNVDIKQSPFATLLDDRSAAACGSAPDVPAVDAGRATCELDDEVAQIADYLHLEEGYFDATVSYEERNARPGLEITIRIALGDEYRPARSGSPTPRRWPRRRSTAPPWSSSSATTSASSA